MMDGLLPGKPPTAPRVLSRRELFARPPADEGPGADYWIRIHRRAMACRFEVTLSGEDAGHAPAAREALDEADRVEAALSVFRDTSELARVNRTAAEGPVEVDEELFGILQVCAELHARTGGAYDVTSTPLSRCWGFLRREGRLPPEVEIAAARGRVGMDGVELDAPRRTVRFRRPGLELNLGSIGTGHALGRLGAILRARGVRHALVSAGGSSVLAVGGRGRGWDVDVRPRSVARGRVARLWLRDAALGMSGAGEQFVEIEGTRYGHVLDPRTGWPASGVLSAAVATPDPARADALSTAFLVGGMDMARDYCAGHAETLAILTPDDGSERPQVFGSCLGAAVEIDRT
jgi:thiamine biosynthesis lipoprotein